MPEPGQLTRSAARLRGGDLATFGTIDGLGLEHGDQQRQQPVRNTAYGASMAMALLAKLGILAASPIIVLDMGRSGVMQSHTQSAVTSLPHGDQLGFAALFGDRSDTGQAAQ